MKSVKEIKADYQLFIDIQIDKYLKQAGKSKFSDDDETGFVMMKIIEAYNLEVAAEHLRLDNLNKAGKTAWFNSIEIDFSEDDWQELLIILGDEFIKISKHFFEVFPFLPEDSLSHLIFVRSALKTYGFPFERFKELLLAEDEPTKMEEDVLLWAFAVVGTVMDSTVEKTMTKQKQHLTDAVLLACEKLDSDLALAVVEEILDDILIFISEEPPLKKKKKR